MIATLRKSVGIMQTKGANARLTNSVVFKILTHVMFKICSDEADLCVHFLCRVFYNHIEKS